MGDVFMIIVCVVMIPVVGSMSYAFVLHFQHPGDKDDPATRLPRFIAMFGIWLALASLLIMPYDVANSRSSSGGVQVNLLWEICYICVGVMLGFVIPFAYF